MCKGCYLELDSPVARTDDTAHVVDLIARVYQDDCMAGECHVVIDDWNLEDEWIDTILDKETLSPTERECMTAMRRMSLDERATALAIHDGFIPEDV